MRAEAQIPCFETPVRVGDAQPQLNAPTWLGESGAGGRTAPRKRASRIQPEGCMGAEGQNSSGRSMAIRR